MLLSERDMRLLERAGHSREKFARYDKHGYAMLRNRRGCCVFYDGEGRRCKAYRYRPLGCRTYPVVCDEEGVAVVDELCPMNETVLEAELRRKGKKVRELLQRTKREAEGRRWSKRSQMCF